MPAPAFRSSGDLTADRRYDYAMALLEDADPAGAADLLEQTLDLVPGWAVGWFALGTARERAGDVAGAAAAWSRAIACDPADALGARLHLARLGAGDVPAAPPAAYVRTLFDAYATGFETALVDGLGYRAPALIAAALAALDPGRTYPRGLDLGCGTGLMAEALAGRVVRCDGVDLSAGMIEVARAKQLYARLAVGDIIADMAERPQGSFDLVTAADVFCYLGDLRPVFVAIARVLNTGGILAFSVEAMVPEDAAGTPRFCLRDSLRYAHAEIYVSDVARHAAFEIATVAKADLRLDRGLPVSGLIFVMTKR